MIKNKFLILLCSATFTLCYIVLKSTLINGKELLADTKIYNYAIANNLIVYEHDEYYNNENFHYITMYNIENGEKVKLLSNTGKIINDSLYFPSISNDGRFITFTSRATNITDDTINDCFDIDEGIIKKCSNIFIYNVSKKQSELIKYDNEMLNGDSFVSVISGNGTNVIFESLSTNNINSVDLSCKKTNGIDSCINIYKYNILTKKINLVSTGNNNKGSNANSLTPSISDDGRFVTFQSTASNIVNNTEYNSSCIIDNLNTCSNIFLVDTLKQTSNIISKNENELFNNNSGNAKISGNGLFIAYETYSTNIDKHINNKQHIILYDIKNNRNTIVSKEKEILNNRDSYFDDISPNGKYLLFRSMSTNLDNINNIMNLYVYNSEDFTKSKIKDFKNDILISHIKENKIYYYDDNIILNEEYIDTYSPIIKENQIIYILKNNITSIKEKIEITDNLSSRNKIDIYIDDISNLSNVGEHEINITAIDEFGNISQETINIIVQEKDEEGPVFNDIEKIKILKGSSVLNLSNYISAVDKIDGKTRIYIVDDGEINLDTTGEYIIKVMSKDNSENITYKEVKVIVYENYDFKYFYEIILILGILIVFIFSIIRVK